MAHLTKGGSEGQIVSSGQGGRKGLVDNDRFVWTAPGFGQHQSDTRFKNNGHGITGLSHDSSQGVHMLVIVL